MNQLLRFFFLGLAAWLLVFAAVQKQADGATAIVGKHFVAYDSGAIQKPELPPLYLLGKEAASFESVSKEDRLHFQTLPVTKLVPRDFSFRAPIRFTFCLIDHKAPVPVFIRGHALRC
jgi:hypothetical protein